MDNLNGYFTEGERRYRMIEILETIDIIKSMNCEIIDLMSKYRMESITMDRVLFFLIVGIIVYLIFCSKRS